MNEPSQTTLTPRENLVGVRIVAGIVDIVLLAVLGVVMTLLFGESTSDDSGFSLNLSGVPFAVFVLLSLAYYFGMENARGQTIGKMVAGIKVVSADGSALTPSRIAVRTLLRFIDGFAFYLVAILVIAVSKTDQRIGDMAANTIVVRTR